MVIRNKKVAEIKTTTSSEAEIIKLTTMGLYGEFHKLITVLLVNYIRLQLLGTIMFG
jgi:hypothetical protein